MIRIWLYQTNKHYNWEKLTIQSLRREETNCIMNNYASMRSETSSIPFYLTKNEHS